MSIHGLGGPGGIGGKGGPQVKQHLVREGETLAIIGEKHGVPEGLVLHADGEWSFFGTILAPEKGIGTGGLDLASPLSVVLAGADGRAGHEDRDPPGREHRRVPPGQQVDPEGAGLA